MGTEFGIGGGTFPTVIGGRVDVIEGDPVLPPSRNGLGLSANRGGDCARYGLVDGDPCRLGWGDAT